MRFISFIKGLFGFKKSEKVVEKAVFVPVKDEPIKEAPLKKEVQEKLTAKEIKSKVRKPRVNTPKFSASKAAIKLAKENGIDLTKVKGSGKDGNITKSDIELLLK